MENRHTDPWRFIIRFLIIFSVIEILEHVFGQVGQHRASSLHVTPSLTNLIGGAEDIQRHLTGYNAI